MKLAAVARLLSRLRAYGTSAGVTKAWDTRGRSHGENEYTHGVHIGIFDRPEHPNQFAPSTSKYFKHPVPDKAGRERVHRLFKMASPVGTRLLNLHDLTPMQKTIVDARVSRVGKVRHDADWAARHLPTCFIHEGNSFLMDGHHRVAHDLDKGDTTTLAKVYKIRNHGTA